MPQCSSNGKSHDHGGSSSNSRSIASLALPWAGLVAVAIAAAMHQQFFKCPETELEEGFFSRGRELFETSTEEATTTHLHHPIINESHKPLFPLDSSDYWGFFFATIGLMIAAGGGVGGGGTYD